MAWQILAVTSLGVMFKLAYGFNMYPPIDPTKLAQAFNITTDCLAALNDTLPDCDQTLFQMVGDSDNYLWQYDNLTTLCGSNCSIEVNDWLSNIDTVCDDQTISAYGKLIPVPTIPGRFLDGMNQVCLSSDTQDAWCLELSYNWTGSDIVRPDCSDPSSCSTDETGADSANTRLANLYPDEILCDNCFIDMLYQRVVSPYFQDTNQLNYLVGQLQDIGDVCSTTIPDITVRADPSYDSAPPATSINFSNTTTTSAPAASTTCSGQEVGGSQKRQARVYGRSVTSRQTSSGCDSLSQQFGVTTGDLQFFTGSDTCEISSPVCLPAQCKLQQISSSVTCDSLAASIPGNVTTIQFLSWNPNILGLCDNPTEGQFICVGAPNGTYSLAPPPLGTAADAGNQQRGGPGGVVTPTTTVSTTVNPASVGPGPTATQSGIASNCNNYAQASKGDDCFDFATSHGLKPTQLYQWNAVLGSNGENCNLQFQAMEYYCIGIAGATTTPSAPGPTQSGIDPACNKYDKPSSGQGCVDFATAHNITPAQLYQWNTVLGANGANCGTQFQDGEFYCIGVSTPTITPPSTMPQSANGPSPTQSGIVPSCKDYAQPDSGQGCFDFATAHGIQPSQLYQWNTILGDNGANCGTQFQAGEWYCIGVTVPSPTQSGISSSCYSYDQPEKGQGCSDFATAHGVQPAKLYQWNPILGDNGANCATQFQAGEWYCVGANS